MMQASEDIVNCEDCDSLFIIGDQYTQSDDGWFCSKGCYEHFIEDNEIKLIKGVKSEYV